MINKQTILELKRFNDRLQEPDFSWKQTDYTLLKDILPAVLLMKDEDNRYITLTHTVPALLTKHQD